jgi:hypothetical protein
MSASEPMAAVARATDPTFAFVDDQAHYDGVYFYAIARDPFARGSSHALIENDRGAYRYGHPGYGWLAWLASAGRASAVPAALLVVGLAGVAVAAYALSMLGAALGWSPWAGLVVAFSPGVVFATTADTSEPVALAALALALLAWIRGRVFWAAVALVACCFIKEPLLLAPLGLLAWLIVEAIRGRRTPTIVRRLLALAAGPALYASWYLYLHGVFGTWPSQQASEDFLTAPFAGWVDSFRRAASLATGTFDRSQLGYASVALLAVVGAILLAGMLKALRVDTPVAPVLFLLALLIFSLNWLGVLYPKDLIREAAIPLALVPFVLATPRGASPG